MCIAATALYCHVLASHKNLYSFIAAVLRNLTTTLQGTSVLVSMIVVSSVYMSMHGCDQRLFVTTNEIKLYDC